ncbi:MAG: CoA pyrophosphatase [Caldilineaceae bacterium]|nr:CoA pyrophosphatase [Caldilineaceae bacterium]
MSTDFATFIAQLQQDLAQPLPGRDAQWAMAPRPRPGAGRYDEPGTDARQGGVLILFYPRAGDVWLPLILRPTYRGVHSGQVGLPGGGYETIDTDITATALREAYEEVGVAPEAVTVLGHLSTLWVSASNYVVQPTVGWTAARPEFRADPYEVERIIETPLQALLTPDCRHEEEWELRNRRATVPYFLVDGEVVWGATAMILSELLALPAVVRLTAAS